ncbi:MAG: HAD family hydrolase [Bacteroidaceae bacterium]|nr:HAD family hydrolase [Bacteroidaceae bacterium]
MIKGLLIDFGGTIDTDGVHWYRMFRDAYPEEVSDELLREAYVHAERTLGRESIILPGDSFCRTLQTKIRLQTEYLQSHGVAVMHPDNVHACCYNKVVSHISTVSGPALERVGLPMVLVTNFYGNMHTVLEEFGLSHLFVDVVESSVVGVRKPDPEIFRLGAKALGLDPSETVMVGDSPEKDIIPAQTAGCRTIWLKGQGWAEADCVPDVTITSLSQICQAFIPLCSSGVL